MTAQDERHKARVGKHLLMTELLANVAPDWKINHTEDFVRQLAAAGFEVKKMSAATLKKREQWEEKKRLRFGDSYIAPADRAGRE